MTLAAIHPQDLVLVDKRGVMFHAEVLKRSHGEVGVRPLARPHHLPRHGRARNPRALAQV